MRLPKEIIRAFPDAEHFDASVKDRKIVLTPVKIARADMTLEDVRDKLAKPGTTEGDVAEGLRNGQWRMKCRQR